MLPNFPRFSRPSFKADTVFAHDIVRQLAWLTEQAKAKGYQDVDELAAKNMAEFARLATQWREQQSLHRPPILLRLVKSTRSALSVLLSQTLRGFALGGSFLMILCIGSVLPRRTRRPA
jgi:hypothetical protein